MAVRDVVQAAAGVGGDKLYVEDVFSTYLYTGNGSTQTITNGIDLDGEGGLVWGKARSTGGLFHSLNDTARGASKSIFSNDTSSQITGNYVTAFNSNGFSIGNNAYLNYNNEPTVSWTFRKSPKFFDCGTYTGNGSSTNTILHNLDAVPGFIVVKRIDSTGNWVVAAGNSSGNYLQLTLNSPLQSYVSAPKTNIATSTTFNAGYLGTNFDGSANVNGASYVYYMFASNAGGFGDDGEQNIISCGSFTTDGSANATVNLGYEPQWVLIKSVDNSDSWFILDNMRGWVTGSNDARLLPNSSLQEQTGSNYGNITSTGFVANGSYYANSKHIYIAIRRGPMKTPESGTEVFATATATGYPRYISNFPVDMFFQQTISGGDTSIASRLTGSQYLSTNLTNAESTSAAYIFDSMIGAGSNNTNSNLYGRLFRRAPSFMDVVAYTGTGSARTVAHNLGVAPELIIVKDRTSGAFGWPVYVASLGVSSAVFLNSNIAVLGGVSYWDSSSPTASNFLLGGVTSVNQSNDNYVAYLFATLAGVSKVGSYTGTAADINIDCGFSSGARFVLIKRTDSTGDWYVWDSARGIVSGNDPYLLLNSTAAENTSTDYIDPLASGFTVTSSAPAALNASGGNYIFLAIA